jgi:hypothetical protein
VEFYRVCVNAVYARGILFAVPSLETLRYDASDGHLLVALNKPSLVMFINPSITEPPVLFRYFDKIPQSFFEFLRSVTSRLNISHPDAFVVI